MTTKLKSKSTFPPSSGAKLYSQFSLPPPMQLCSRTGNEACSQFIMLSLLLLPLPLQHGVTGGSPPQTSPE